MAAALVVVILLPQPGEQPVAEEPAVPEEDDFEYWNQLRRVHGWSEVAATISRQRHGDAAPHTPVKSRPKRNKRRAVTGSGKAQGATAAAAAAEAAPAAAAAAAPAAAAVAAAEVAAEVVVEGEEAVSSTKDRPKRKKRRAVSSSGKAQLAAAGAVARTAVPLERLEAAAVVARATSEIGEVGAAAAPADVRTIAVGALVAEEEMVVEARATAAVAEDKLGLAAVAEEVEGEEGARVALARTQPQGDSAAEQEPAAVIVEPAAEPAAERLRIRLAPRPVALREHTQRLGSDAESRGQPDTLQKLDLVRSGGAVPTEHNVRAARAAQAAGAAAKLTISLLPRGAKKKRKRKKKRKSG